MSMLLVAHELGQPLHVVEQMTTSEMLLHLGFMEMRAKQEAEAAERMKRGDDGGKFKKVVSIRKK